MVMHRGCRSWRVLCLLTGGLILMVFTHEANNQQVPHFPKNLNSSYEFHNLSNIPQNLSHNSVQQQVLHRSLVTRTSSAPYAFSSAHSPHSLDRSQASKESSSHHFIRNSPPPTIYPKESPDLHRKQDLDAPLQSQSIFQEPLDFDDSQRNVPPTDSNTISKDLHFPQGLHPASQTSRGAQDTHALRKDS